MRGMTPFFSVRVPVKITDVRERMASVASTGISTGLGRIASASRRIRMSACVRAAV
jgi:hypothetical protein